MTCSIKASEDEEVESEQQRPDGLLYLHEERLQPHDETRLTAVLAVCHWAPCDSF